MKTRVLPYLLVFIGSLVGAFVVSLPNKKSVKGQIWWNLGGKINSVQYLSAEKKVEFDTNKLWIETFKSSNGAWIEESSFKVSPVGKDILKDLESLEAIKVIGSYKDIDPKEYGFQEDHAKLEIRTQEETYRLELGKRNFQSSEIFVHDVQKNLVFLMRNRPVNLLDSAETRLYERRVHNINLEGEVQKIELKSSGRTRTFKKASQVKGGGYIWKKPDDTDAPEGLENWLMKVLKLQVKRYGTSNESQRIDRLQPFLSASFQTEKDVLDVIHIYQVESGSKDLEFWLKSSFSQYYVLLDAGRVKGIKEDFSNFVR